MVAGESVEMQVIVDGDPKVNSRASLTVGPAGGRKSINHITDHLPSGIDTWLSALTIDLCFKYSLEHGQLCSN